MEGLKIVRASRKALLADDFWDNFLKDCGGDTPVYVQSWYIEICAKKQWEAFLMVLDGRLIGALPCAYKYKFGFLRVGYTPFFVQQIGVICLPEYAECVQESVALFYRAMQKRYWWFYYSFSCNNYKSNFVLPQGNLRSCFTYKLDLGQSIENIRLGFSKSHRHSIKKAGSCKIVKKDDFLPILIENFVKLKIGSIKNLNVRDYALLLNLGLKALEQGKAQVWVAENEGQVLAGVLFIESGQEIIYLFGYTSEEGRIQKSMFVLFDVCLEKWSGKYKFLDFEGGDQASGRFFYGFGAKPHYFWHWTYRVYKKL